MELSKQYQPDKTEGRIYREWEKAKAFKPSDPQNSAGKAFAIAIPPPNITGSLHLGHALNNTVQDILIRYHRMRGESTLWIPGADHAGIATQNAVEKELKKEGKTRQQLGRDKFLKKVWAWKKRYGGKILNQLKKMGCSCDWDHLTFTLDKNYQKAVLNTFVYYYKKGWIYQGERVVNWCPRCQSTLSDLEVEHKREKAKLYYFNYDKHFPITIATTRPETKFGDSAVAVNPSDSRYKKYLGKVFKVNFAGVERKIKIIADQSIDKNFGSGALGLTPAHSLADAELAKKHGLDTIKVIDENARMTEQAGEAYKGLKTTQAAQKVLEFLKQEGLLKKTQTINHNLAVCYRCDTAIEPIPSQQWFVKMAELKKPAIRVLKENKILFTPVRFRKICLDWLEKSYDWCISRQLWWGHRLPVWRRKLKGKDERVKIYVGLEPPKGEGWAQSEDVLDTWFSSALWTFAALGWTEPGKKTPDLEIYHPTAVLSTARDIIFLWVGRMIFSSLELVGEIPFKQVYIHPTVLNIKGQRMSKSLGTGVDPIEMIEKYGADATRFGLIYQNTGTQDMKFSESNIVAARNFCNKIWNIARFIMMNLESEKLNAQNEKPHPKTKSDRKILGDLERTQKSVYSDIEHFRFGQAARTLYDFIWHSLADEYLEESKGQLKDDKLTQNTRQILLFILIQSLKLLHPFIPFITEEIWSRLYETRLVDEKLLIIAKIDVGK